MSSWKKICCAVDFSPESRQALVEAAELAWRSGGDLVLLHVDDRPHGVEPDSLGAPEAMARCGLELERQLGEWADIAATIASAPVRFALRAGGAVEEIIRFAREERIEVIVMGTHGRSGRAEAVVGSVAAAVVREAPCSVVVVRGRVVRPSDQVVCAV